MHMYMHARGAIFTGIIEAAIAENNPVLFERRFVSRDLTNQSTKQNNICCDWMTFFRF